MDIFLDTFCRTVIIRRYSTSYDLIYQGGENLRRPLRPLKWEEKGERTSLRELKCNNMKLETLTTKVGFAPKCYTFRKNLRFTQPYQPQFRRNPARFTQPFDLYLRESEKCFPADQCVFHSGKVPPSLMEPEWKWTGVHFFEFHCVKVEEPILCHNLTMLMWGNGSILCVW